MNDLFFDNRIAGLIKKYLQDEISEEERNELQTWLDSSEKAKEVFEEMTSEEKLPEELAHFVSSRERVLVKIREMEPGTRLVVGMNEGFRWRPWLAAAVVIGLAILGYFYLKTPEEKNVAKVEIDNNRFKNDIPPGGDQAILRLGDGTLIELDSSVRGIIAQQGDVSIAGSKGALEYDKGNGNSDIVYSNTVETKKGGRYRLTLSDGTQVWLNAMSSVKFPTRFPGTNREVEITGEVFFDVARNRNIPFIVKYNGLSIEVTGTEFNVSAYTNEKSVTTTLVEGAVKVKSGNVILELRPGEQAELTGADDLKINKSVNIDEVVAWKEINLSLVTRT